MKAKVKSIGGITIYKTLLLLFIYTIFWRGKRQNTAVPQICVHSVTTSSGGEKRHNVKEICRYTSFTTTPSPLVYMQTDSHTRCCLSSVRDSIQRPNTSSHREERSYTKKMASHWLRKNFKSCLIKLLLKPDCLPYN